MTTLTHLEKIITTHGWSRTDRFIERREVWTHPAGNDIHIGERDFVILGGEPLKGSTQRQLVNFLGLQNDRIFRPEDFNRDETGYLGMLPTAFLAAAARGEIDLNALAKEELADSGRDEYGDWIGFPAASDRMTGGMMNRPDGRRVWVTIPDHDE